MAAGRDIDDLPKNDANYTALTPLLFLERAALVHPTRKSVVHGSHHYTWLQTYRRCRRLASALSNRSIGLGSTVAVIAPNVPAIYEAHFGVPMSGAVLNCVNIRLNASTIAFLLNAPQEDIIFPLPHTVNVMTAGAAPPPSVLFEMSKRGFRVTHTYGLSETYGPATVCAWKPEWDSLPPVQQARLNARQGVRYIALEGLDVINSQTMQPVPADGTTIGEIMMRGNAVMKGYLKNPKANEESFANGWFHSGDLAVKHPDNYIEIKDRSKDIIISGGENISSVEVENILYLHPAIFEVSVVARPDERWGESPCAFVTLKPNVDKSSEQHLAEDILKFCKSKMPAYWVPKSIVFGPLPKTATGKIQKHLLRAKAKEMWPVKVSKL
ncbi:hypothetical protein UlMin_009634 [Ulmus minor]